ncbi:hypothetical protein [Paraburkholderia caffeinilytica]|uniref:hypothetical protein n=1 Tax=Paraburkholderia caffeinilytica TaxID=1761016 RepID=UPI003DA1BBA0
MPQTLQISVRLPQRSSPLANRILFGTQIKNNQKQVPAYKKKNIFLTRFLISLRRALQAQSRQSRRAGSQPFKATFFLAVHRLN